MEDLTLSLDAFIRTIGINYNSPPIVFLGAGTSISSGIPPANKCIWEWKKIIYSTQNPNENLTQLEESIVQEKIQKWFDSNVGYPRLNSPEEYEFYIEKCFPLSRSRRQFFAEKVRRAKPSVGYQLFCLMAEHGIFTSTWTTNFDGLIAKAAAGYEITPIEIGMDCQKRIFRQPKHGELICVSLHGDYRYDSLKNTNDELKYQETILKNALLDELRNKSLIVIGYSGRDKSIMDILHKAFSHPGETELFWCGMSAQISEPVKELIQDARKNNHSAFYIKTNGFDDTLIRLAFHCLPTDCQKKINESVNQNELNNYLNKTTNPINIPNKEIDLNKPIRISLITNNEKFDDIDIIANISFHPKGENIAYSFDNKLLIAKVSDNFPKIIGEHNAKMNNDSNSLTNLPNIPISETSTKLEGKDHREAHEHKITNISFSPNGRLIASGDNNGYLKIWDFHKKRELISLKAHEDYINAIAFSPSSHLLATAGYDEIIKIWNITDLIEGDPRHFIQFTKKSNINKKPLYPQDIEQIMSMTFSRDGKLLATGDQKGLVVVRDIYATHPDFQIVFRKQIHNAHVNSMVFSPDKNYLVTASEDERIRILNLTDKSIKTIGIGEAKHKHSVRSLAFSPDGRILLSAGDDKIIKFWNFKEHNLIHNFVDSGHKSTIDRVAFNPIKYIFASNSYDDSIKLWEVSNEGNISNTVIDFK